MSTTNSWFLDRFYGSKNSQVDRQQSPQNYNDNDDDDDESGINHNYNIGDLESAHVRDDNRRFFFGDDHDDVLFPKESDVAAAEGEKMAMFGMVKQKVAISFITLIDLIINALIVSLFAISFNKLAILSKVSVIVHMVFLLFSLIGMIGYYRGSKMLISLFLISFFINICFSISIYVSAFTPILLGEYESKEAPSIQTIFSHLFTFLLRICLLPVLFDHYHDGLEDSSKFAVTLSPMLLLSPFTPNIPSKGNSNSNNNMNIMSPSNWNRNFFNNNNNNNAHPKSHNKDWLSPKVRIPLKQ